MTPQQEQRATALIISAQQGDTGAYAELLTLLAATARQYARNRVGDVPWLDDVAQETLVDGGRGPAHIRCAASVCPVVLRDSVEPDDRRAAQGAPNQRPGSRR